MKLLDLTLESPKYHPAANIALDEALLETAEIGQLDSEVLRLWTPSQPLVVLGRSSPFETEVKHEFCEREQIEVFRRCSGGASIVTSPGCLMYAVLLDYRKRPHLRMLEQAHQFVMGTLQAALEDIGIVTTFQGTCDLTIDGRKVSGNALRCKRNWMIYHGTMICKSMDLGLIGDCLGDPKRQPDYREGRSHEDFVTRLPCSTEELSTAIQQRWSAVEALRVWPQQMTSELVETKYATSAWTQKV